MAYDAIRGSAIGLLLLGNITIGLTQTLTESLDSVEAVVYWNSPRFVPYRAMAIKNRVWLDDVFKNESSLIAVSNSWGSGKFQPAQGADKTNAFRFETEGKTRWNKTDFWGSFYYERSSEDSTALRHQTRWNEDAPFYFASMKKNNYHRETYKLDGAIQQQFLDGRLPLTLAVDYRLGSHYANNDPRGSLSDMNLLFELALGHRTKHWDYHAKGILGYGSERVSVGYLNDRNNNGLERPDYTTWQMNGYGSAKAVNSNIRYDDLINKSGFGIHLKYSPNVHHVFYINGQYVKEKQSFRQSDSSPLTYKYFNDYDKDIVEGQLLWSMQRQNNQRITISIDGKVERGADYNYLVEDNPNPNNYVYQRDQATLAGMYTIGKNTITAKIGINDLNRADGITGNKLTYTQYDAGIGLSRSFVLSGYFSLQGQFNYSYQHTLNHELIMPTINAKEITNRIIYQDYLYQSASVQEWSTRWTFSNHKLRRNWSVIVQADYQFRGGLIELEEAAAYQPGKDWFLGKVGLSYAF